MYPSVCVCVCVCEWVCVWVCVCVWVSVCVSECVCVWVSECAWVCEWVRECVSECVSERVCVWAHARVSASPLTTFGKKDDFFKKIGMNIMLLEAISTVHLNCYYQWYGYST